MEGKIRIINFNVEYVTFRIMLPNGDTQDVEIDIDQAMKLSHELENTIGGMKNKIHDLYHKTHTSY